MFLLDLPMRLDCERYLTVQIGDSLGFLCTVKNKGE
jgi:hypothetical protein